MDVRVRLTFPESLVRQPLIWQMVRESDVVVNIRKADVGDREGWILCELEGEPDQVEAALAWLTSKGVGVSLIGDLVEG
ncbi:MAG: NIL domain-containing protein [Actinomycetota bacterium]|nr:NIL domain-containing protein [Actinomycetota bacterium]